MAKIRTATRTVSNAGQLRTLVNVATPKAIGELPTESLVEFDGLIELRADPDVVSIQVQPETFNLEIGDVISKYTPDVRFVRRDGRIAYREFKDSSKPIPPEVETKLRVAKEHLSRLGYEFDVRTSSELRSGHRTSNLRRLKRYANWPTSTAFQAAVINFIGDSQRLDLHELRTHVGQAAFGALYRMLWDQVIDADLESAPLSGATAVRKVRS